LRLTAEIKADFRAAALKVVVVQREKLWKELGYSGFEQYMNMEFCKSRSWGYDIIVWQEAMDVLDANGIVMAQLSQDAAQVYREYKDRPEVFVQAFRQLLERGENNPSQEVLRAECKLQADYLYEIGLSDDLTQEEFQAYRKLQGLKESWQLEDFVKAGGATPETLVKECTRLVRKPALRILTQVVRGPELIALVDTLEPVAKEAAKVPELHKKMPDIKEKRREANKGVNLLKKEEDALQAEIDRLTGKEPEKPEQPEQPDDDEDKDPADLAADAAQFCLELLQKDGIKYVLRIALALDVLANHLEVVVYSETMVEAIGCIIDAAERLDISKLKAEENVAS
jgi:hypothetical protein